MKVVLDVSAVPARPAGAGRYITEIARRVSDHVDSLSLVCVRDDADRWRLTNPSAEINDVVPRTRGARLIYEAALLGRGSVVRDFTVWHSPHYSMPHRSSLPVVVTIHDMTYFTHPQFHERRKVLFFTRAIRYASQHAAALIAVSDFTARQMRDICPSDVPVVVAPHGVDLDKFTPGDDARALPAGVGARFILFCGTLEPRKGLDVLLDAFGEIAANDRDIQLCIVGQTGWHLAHVKSKIAQHPYRTRIVRLGYVGDDILVALLRRATVVAYPSRGEGFGLPALEAMACGAPLVTSANTPMADFVRDVGWLSEPGDVASLAETLVVVSQLSQPERESYALAARRRAEQYTWEKSVRQHLVAYEQASAV